VLRTPKKNHVSRFDPLVAMAWAMLNIGVTPTPPAMSTIGLFLVMNDNVLSIAEFAGKQDKVDGYYAKLKTLCRDSFEKLASACYEDSIIDLSKVPMHNDKLPRLVMEMDSEAKKFGIALRLVGVPEAKKALSQLVETASLPFFGTLAEAKAA